MNGRKFLLLHTYIHTYLPRQLTAVAKAIGSTCITEPSTKAFHSLMRAGAVPPICQASLPFAPSVFSLAYYHLGGLQTASTAAAYPRIRLHKMGGLGS